jgi:hypothetical protein
MPPELYALSSPSGPIETLGSQAFRESAYPINRLVVRFG